MANEPNDGKQARVKCNLCQTEFQDRTIRRHENSHVHKGNIAVLSGERVSARSHCDSCGVSVPAALWNDHLENAKHVETVRESKTDLFTALTKSN